MSKKPSTAKPPQNSGGWVGDTANLIYLLRHPLDATLFGLGTVVWWLFSKFWLLWFALGFSLWVGVQIGAGPGPGLLVFFCLVAAWWSWRNRHPKKDVKGWWSQQVLAQALVDAGVLSMVPSRDKSQPASLPTLSYRGKPEHTDHGDSVTIALPQSKTLAAVTSKQDSLAAGLRVPAARLMVTQGEDDPANVVTIHVGHTSARKETASSVAKAERTHWAEPLRIGHDPRGLPIVLATFEANSLVAGRPGSGKTTGISKPFLSHYLLDPETRIFLLDGKGSVEDYGACRPMCELFVSGTDDAAVPDTLGMLTTVLDLVRARNAEGGEHPGVLLLLEEFQDVRAAASKDQRERLDVTLGRIVRMGRAVGVHVLVSTQRPTTDDLPSGTRNLLSQRVALMLRNGADAALVLGMTPGAALPSRRGQALFTDGGPIVGVELDRLTNEAWLRVCKRASKLRAAVPDEEAPTRPMLTVVPSPEPTIKPVADPTDELLEIVADAGELSASNILDRLSSDARTVFPDARTVGVALKDCEGVVRVRRGNGFVWRLADQSARV